MPKSRDPEEAALDPVGAVLSIVGIVSLVYGLIEAPEQRAGRAPTTLGRVRDRDRRARRSSSRGSCTSPSRCSTCTTSSNPAFSTGTGGMILVFLSMYGVIFLITQYFQLVLGYSAARRRRCALLPIAIDHDRRRAVHAAAQRAVRRAPHGRVRHAQHLDRRSCLLAQLGVHSPYAFMVVCFIPLTGGIALTMSPMTASIMSAVPARRAGAGSAMNDATRELGAALGIAVLGSVAASRYDSQIAPFLHGLTADAALDRRHVDRGRAARRRQAAAPRVDGADRRRQGRVRERAAPRGALRRVARARSPA